MQGFILPLAAAALLSVSTLSAKPTQTASAENTNIKIQDQTPDEPDGRKERLDSAVVSASRAGKATPVTYTMVSGEELRVANPMASLPMALNLQPSVISDNEGGTGLGYSTLRVRGIGGSQLNVTLNGITLNDSESQEVFWVNIPAISSVLSSVQVQRGLGTSSNGPGAFGASLSMNTTAIGTKPYGSFEIGRGAWNTLTTVASAGTGLLPSGFYVSAAYSRDLTDGYIRNAFAKVQSGFAMIGFLKGNNSLKLTYLMGDQHTGITWNGLSMEKYKAGEYTYNDAGEYYDAQGNVRYYDNDTDNYTQHNLQLNYTHAFGEHFVWSTTLNWTIGNGYYENYKAQKKFSKYGLENYVDADGIVQKKSDFIIRKWMRNDYLVANSTLKYSTDRLALTAGVYAGTYDCDHYGKVRWSSVLGDRVDYNDPLYKWYKNNGKKKELSFIARGEYSFAQYFSAYADLQYRHITYGLTGNEDDMVDIGYSTPWNFFNPRAGLSFQKNGMKAYASVALGNREPSRSDLKERLLSMHESGESEVGLKPEKMTDIELGFEHSLADYLTYGVNFYLMEYNDILLETGRLSGSGRPIKENAGRAWRRGVELSAAWTVAPQLRIDGNLTLSTNKIKDYTACYPIYDTPDDYNYIGLKEETHHKVKMLNSPSVIAMARLTLKPFASLKRGSLRSTTLALDGKYIGRQYWDNTECKDRSIPGYFVSNLSLTHEFSIGGGFLGLGMYVNNLWGKRYYSYAAVSRETYADGSWYQWEGLRPQAPRSAMFKLSYRF